MAKQDEPPAFPGDSAAPLPAGYISLFDAVTRIESVAYGGFRRSVSVTQAKNARYGTSIGSHERRTDCHRRLIEAARRGLVQIFAFHALSREKLAITPDAYDFVSSLSPQRWGLGIHSVLPIVFARLPGEGSGRQNPMNERERRVTRNSTLIVSLFELESWIHQQKEYGVFPSQFNKKNRLVARGRPSKIDRNLLSEISNAVELEQWTAASGVPALVTLLVSKGVKISKNSVSKALDTLVISTGDPRFQRDRYGKSKNPVWSWPTNSPDYEEIPYKMKKSSVRGTSGAK